MILHEPSYVAYVPAIVFAGGTVRPRRDPPRGRLRPRPGGGRGGDHAADEGAVPRLSVQPDRRRPAATTSRTSSRAIAERHDLLVYSDEIYDRLAYGVVPPPGVQRAAGDARPDDPDGRLLEGLRDDRLAGRLPGGAGGDPRGDRQGPPVRDHVGPDDGPGRGARGARRRRGRRRADASPSTTGGGASSSTASTRSACGRSSRAARSTPSREVTTATGLVVGGVRRGAARARSASRSIPGSAFGPSAARATSGPATRRRTSSSRRPSAGSGGSWTATGPALAEARVIEPPTGAASPAPPPAMAPGSVASSAAVPSAARGRPRRSSSPTSRAAPGSGRSSRWRWPRRSPSTTPCCGRSSRAAAASCSRRPATACSPCSTIRRPRSAAALDGQRALRDADWGETGALRVRMAIHSGTAEVRDGDYFGQALNRAARILAIGHGGQILCSAMSAVLVGDGLPAGVELRDLGSHRLRDLDRPEQVFQVVGRRPATRLPAAPLAQHPADEPARPADLVRRAGARARRARGPGRAPPARDAHRDRRHGQDAADARGGRPARRPVRRRRLARGAGAARRPGPGRLGGRPRARRAGAPGPARARRRSQAFLAEKELLLLLDNAEHLVDARRRDRRTAPRRRAAASGS